MQPLYKSLVIEDSADVGVDAAPKTTFRCVRGDCETVLRILGDFHTHNGGNYLNGDFGTAPPGIC
jgi:hypothetical protein